MRARPISPPALADELAERVAAIPGRVRAAVDGAPAARPEDLADALAGPLRLRGRAVLRVSARDFLRPASLRFEYGRTDPDAFYTDWLDTGGLLREVLRPLGPGGSGRALPALWNNATDRAARADYVTLPEDGVLLLDGFLLLGRGLPLEHVVHLWLSPAALTRRVAEDERWTLPAYARYEAEADPVRTADTVVRADDPRHPALVEQVPGRSA